MFGVPLEVATLSPPWSPGEAPAAAGSPGPGALHRLPHPRQLAALGSVLCLFRPGLGGELAGWANARSVASQVLMDSDGLHESLWFLDAQGQCCWRLHLLPDSDFLAWDQLASQLPVLAGEAAATATGSHVGERLWRRLAGRLKSGQWLASPLRLHAVGNGGGQLALGPAALSTCGWERMQRIAQGEGAEWAMPLAPGRAAIP